MDGWNTMKHLLIHCAPHLGGKSYDPHKQIYDLNVIPGEDLAYFIDRGSLLQKNIRIPNQAVSTNLLFEKVITQLMECQGFPQFIGTSYSKFFYYNKLTAALPHTLMKHFSSCTITWRSLKPHPISPWIPHQPPHIPHN